MTTAHEKGSCAICHVPRSMTAGKVSRGVETRVLQCPLWISQWPTDLPLGLTSENLPHGLRGQALNTWPLRGVFQMWIRQSLREVGGVPEEASPHRAEDASHVWDLACVLAEGWLGQAGSSLYPVTLRVLTHLIFISHTQSCIFNSCHMVKQPKHPGGSLGKIIFMDTMLITSAMRVPVLIPAFSLLLTHHEQRHPAGLSSYQ